MSLISLSWHRVATFLKNLHTKAQLMLIGLIVGLFSGFASVVLKFILHHFSHFTQQYKNTFYIILLPCIGLIITVLYMRLIVRDSSKASLSVPDIIYSVGSKKARIKLIPAVGQLIANAFTISSGASAGPEGPVIVGGSSIGSNIASFFNTSVSIRRAAAGSGAAGAIAAIFNAPLTGIVFTMEIILGEWSSLNLLPLTISSVTATIVSWWLDGNRIPFSHKEIHVIFNDILAVVVLSIFVALVAVIYIKTKRLSSFWFKKLFKNKLIRALIGGLLSGVIIYFFFEVSGEGYSIIQNVIDGKLNKGILFLTLLILFKILATAFTLGSGGVGGIFAPGLFIGSLSGDLFYKLIVMIFGSNTFSQVPLYSLCGMAGLLSAILQAPLTGIFLIVEITGGYEAILPLLLVAFLAPAFASIFEKYSIYQASLISKGLLIRPRTDAGVVTEIKLEEILETNITSVTPHMLLKDFLPLISQSKRNLFVVEDEESKKFLGMVDFNDLKPYIFDNILINSVIIEEVMRVDFVEVSLNESVASALAKFDESGAWSLPVIDNGYFAGLISKSTILDHYRQELKIQTEI